MWRVLITGSRTWDNHLVIQKALAQIAQDHDWRVMVVHGDCPDGADAIAKDWARRMIGTGVDHDPYPADWKKHGKPAGHIRDKEMVDRGADECLAFIHRCVKPTCRLTYPHGSHGTTATAGYAEKAGIPTRRWTDLSRPTYDRPLLKLGVGS